MKCTAYSRAERSSSADSVSSCKQSPRLSLSSAAPLKNTPFRVCFFNVCKVCLHKFVRFISKIARGACRLRSMPFLASNPSSSLAVSSSMVFYNRSLSAAVLFVLIFQLEDIVDFLLIHRPYGFIVQFLMINTGNGGSFVQL